MPIKWNKYAKLRLYLGCVTSATRCRDVIPGPAQRCYEELNNQYSNRATIPEGEEATGHHPGQTRDLQHEVEGIPDGNVGPVKSDVCGHQLRHGPSCDGVRHPRDFMQPKRGQEESGHRPDGHSQDVHCAQTDRQTDTNRVTKKWEHSFRSLCAMEDRVLRD